jgi:hypothetical protein
MANKETKKDIVGSNLIFIFSISLVFFILTLSIINFKHYFSNSKVLGAQTEVKSNLINETYWREFLIQNPTYFDGWIELTKTEIESNNKDAANKALFTAEKIDPNSDIIMQLKEEIKRLP